MMRSSVPAPETAWGCPPPDDDGTNGLQAPRTDATPSASATAMNRERERDLADTTYLRGLGTRPKPSKSLETHLCRVPRPVCLIGVRPPCAWRMTLFGRTPRIAAHGGAAHLSSCMPSESELRRELADVCRVLFRLHLVDYMGHPSVRIRDTDRVLIKPRHSGQIRAQDQIRPDQMA